MSRNSNITLLCVNGRSPHDWVTWTRSHHIIPVRGPVAAAALSSGLGEMEKEIVRVVFDRSASCKQFLVFLSVLPQEYRGDVLLIEESGEGFLSSVLRGDGRAVYQLQPEDVEFYLRTTFAPSRSGVISGQSNRLESAA